MNTKKSLNPSSLLAANWMSKYSNCAWSDAAASNNNLSGNATSAYLTTGELNLMSHFSLNNSLALQSSAESDATSSSTSSSSATNNSSTSLSLSPNTDARDTPRPAPKSVIQASNHLLELQKEIKEEEEEIFADINSLINSRSNLYSTLTEDEYEEDDGVNFDSEENLTRSFKNHTGHTNNNIDHLHHLNHRHDSNHNQHNNTITVTNNNNSKHHHHHNHILIRDKPLFPVDSDDLNDYQSQDTGGVSKHEYQSDTVKVIDTRNEHLQDDHQYQVSGSCRSRVSYFTNQDDCEYLQEPLDQELNDEHEAAANYENDSLFLGDKQNILSHPDDPTGHQNYPNFQAIIPSNLPKPCVFFLEGNCRRSDCKYSHDLSNITCKYWHEGFCFKGELCPFLHDYNQPSDPLDPNLLDEDGLSLLSKKQLIPTFAIESEADFPSLPLDAPPTSALNDSTKSSVNTDLTAIKDQILSSNSAVLFKTVKKKRKKG